jgi:2-methylisocitrate lyase-like PEP mutase family enzyme
METSIKSRAEAFSNLHQQPGLFVIPNPWDAGSARILETLGFKALATTSGGLAFMLGRPDGAVTREESIENVRIIMEATSLPVSADFENGYGHKPEDCANTITQAAKAGISGGSIEDATGNPADPIYPFELSVERVKAAVQAARSAPQPFTLTARSENFIKGRPDLKDTIKRLEAYADAGADVLFAPGIKTREEIQSVVKAVAPRPVNVIMAVAGANLSLHELEDLGVKRVSVGSALSRAALGALYRAAEEILQKGTFNFAEEAKPYADLNNLFKKYQG